ncbi:MAG: response regulator [Pyrinomonadaceae bacterium]
MIEGRKLLVADDSPTIRKVISLTFADEGVEVVTAGNGAEALESLRAFVPDVILADVSMPEPNGYRLCEHVKRDERLRHIPVVLLVGTFEPFNDAEARRVGADDVLTKPFQSIRDMLNRVGRMLGSGNPAEAEMRPEAFPAQGTSYGTNPPAPPAPVQPRVSLEQPTLTSRPAAAVDRFADPGMDDPSIESRSVGAVPPRRAEPPVVTPTVLEEEEEFETLAARPEVMAASTAGEEEFVTVSVNAPAQKTSDANPAFAATASVSPVASSAGFGAHSVSAAAAADDTLLDLGDSESAASPVADESSDDFFLDLDDEPSAAPASRSAAVYPKTFERKSASSPASAATAIAAPPAAAPRPSVKAEAALPQSATANSQAPQMSFGQLSPEMLDAIARRVVELMSERVVQEIAWEVVPELAERMIRKKLDEEKQGT